MVQVERSVTKLILNLFVIVVLSSYIRSAGTETL
jgi:hypothetical protein